MEIEVERISNRKEMQIGCNTRAVRQGKQKTYLRKLHFTGSLLCWRLQVRLVFLIFFLFIGNWRRFKTWHLGILGWNTKWTYHTMQWGDCLWGLSYNAVRWLSMWTIIQCSEVIGKQSGKERARQRARGREMGQILTDDEIVIHFYWVLVKDPSYGRCNVQKKKRRL